MPAAKIPVLTAFASAEWGTRKPGGFLTMPCFSNETASGDIASIFDGMFAAHNIRRP